MNPALETLSSAAPAIAMLGCFACLLGGGWLLYTRRDRRKGALLLVMALVLLGNVAIWTV